MVRKHLRPRAELERQIEKAHQIRAETASALILDGLIGGMGPIRRRIVARITTAPPRRA
jgi:hypothetical protein